MDLPDELLSAIENLVSRSDPTELKHAAKSISLRYRQLEKTDPVILKTDVDHISYLLTRLPATFSVLSRIFQEISTLIPDAFIQSLLDLGTGPGTSLWAAIKYHNNLLTVTLIDQDQYFLKIGQDLASVSEHPILRTAKWHRSDMLNAEVAPHDLVIVSYALNEINKDDHRSFLQKLWGLTQQVIVIVEPGTKQGFANILDAREEMIRLGGHVIAPCPHTERCPIFGNDWCHFSVRLQRSSLHKKLKGGSLPFEDEKYSYLVVSKSPGHPFSSRILRHPIKHKGHIQFKLCTSQGLKNHIVSKGEKGSYKKAKAFCWGDIGDFIP